ncbi:MULTISPECIES: 4-(cytidine 5'-diphospho)-2-C-methyl-D-erythritol kinase [Thalassospira]|uniref:4-diphosphocytidyl-2-C-methyl-D-erythritol kinase n=2 Tax=Thalassospira TaxID=168934 RepID=A0A367WEG2_9PROT|nr:MULTISPECIES: 4-(cytidine 5'-diphospho)-2-C-methyl-D-erythritol kinase [Thalassospira]MDG4717564.1 4-(cytidine 5'-diphospho)-2-C-methyl-D-erythritol kinase [Thalassospira sp. FZY0004]RCK38971.1 4-diphosphocytidyl-2C-methyl-D-erythritol kinase [Thalassospira profundimaris]
MSATYSEQAPAKINLFLHVTGKRDDGYHLLESLVCFTATGDVLSGECRDDGAINLTITGPMSASLVLDDTRDNLVVRAARLLQDESGTALGADLVLDKRLPVASGIGGGSADAAAAIRLLCDMWQLDLDQKALARISLTLGADVPVCLHGKTCLMSGIGEELTDLPDLPEIPMVLINPGKAVSTPEIFKTREDEGFSISGLWDIEREFSSGASLADALSDCGNDLTLAATSILPEICDVLNALAREEGCLLARMSGSGATCFGIYDTKEQAEKAANAIASQHVDWWISPTQTLCEQTRELSNIGASFPD